MGAKTSKPEATNTGQANNANNINISEQLEFGSDLQVYATCLIAIVQVAKLILYFYALHKKSLKKKYSSVMYLNRQVPTITSNLESFK